MAAEARAGTVRHDERRSADGSGTVARTPVGRQDRGEPGGIGLKLDGDQLRGLESVRLARASSPPPADAGSLATAGLALGLPADRAIDWARDHFRRPEG